MVKRMIRNIFSFVVLTILCVTIFEIININILPDKYFVPLLVAEGVLFLLGCLLYNLKNKFLIVLGVLLYLISMAGNLFASYYIGKVNHYIDDNFAVETYTVTTHYYLIAAANDPVQSIEEFTKETPIQYYQYSRAVGKAIEKLGKYSYKAVDDAFGALLEVRNNLQYFLVPSASYEYVMEATTLIEKDSFRILYEFDVEQEIVRNNKVPDSYNVYINGLDYTGIMRDFNMIATVNTKTHKVVLTSIPRDYYMEIPAYHIKDTLMYTGALDSEVSKEALENLFDIKIDYTININANTVVDVVDAIGGVEYCSDDYFTGSYIVNGKGHTFTVSKGCKTYNGQEILGIARIRKAFEGGDRARQDHMRKIMISIIKKMASTTTLTNYQEVLNSFDGLYTTDMNKETITNLIKEGIKDMNFEIIEQSVNGTDSIGVGHMGTQEAWIMTPDMNTVKAASKQINEVLKEK